MNEQEISQRIIALDDAIDNLIELRSERVAIELEGQMGPDDYKKNRSSFTGKVVKTGALLGGAGLLTQRGLKGMKAGGHKGVGGFAKGMGQQVRSDVTGAYGKVADRFRKKKPVQQAPLQLTNNR